MQTTDYKKFLTRFTCSCQQKYFSGKCEKLVASKKELKAFMQIDQGNYGTMRFMSKQVSLPKISSILQKLEIGPKTDIRL